MIKPKKITPYQRLLVVSPINRYRLVGPGRVWLTPRQRVLADLNVGTQVQTLRLEQVYTAEKVPLHIEAKVIYHADPSLFTPDLLPRLPGLNSGGWQSVVEWQTNYVVRQLLAAQPWRNLGPRPLQQRLERYLTQALGDRLKVIGLKVLAVNLVKFQLPDQVEQALVNAEQTLIEAESRAKVLQSYRTLFGPNLTQAMPLIIQWELLNAIDQKDPQILLTSGLAPKLLPLEGEVLTSLVQLPLHQGVRN